MDSLLTYAADLWSTAWAMAQAYERALDAIQQWNAAGFLGSVAA